MFKNATIKSIGANPLEYHIQAAKRGEPGFVMSSGHLRKFFEGPSKWVRGAEIEKTDSMEYGSLFDNIVLTPELFEMAYAIQPVNYESKVMKCPQCGSISDAAKCRSCKVERIEDVIEKPWNNNSDTCTAWIGEQAKAGREVVTSGTLLEAQTAKKRLLEDEKCRRFMDACQKQVWCVAEWHDEETGLVVPVKCLIDFVSKADSAFPKSLGDLKTTKSAAPIAWARWAHHAGYEVQAAWYTDIFVAATRREIVNFCFVLSENTAPFEVGRRFMSQDIDEPGMDEGDIASGRRQYLEMIRGYCQCLKSGKWPGYDDTDEASGDGWTLVKPDVWAENRRLFAPKYMFKEPEKEIAIPDDETDFVP